MSNKYVYFEPQDSKLCGQHCLNNLVQENFFDVSMLSQIATELDMAERQIEGSSMFQQSNNVDEQGNFSVQVLKVALEKYKRMLLVQWNNSDKILDPLKQKGFIINNADHW